MSTLFSDDGIPFEFVSDESQRDQSGSGWHAARSLPDSTRSNRQKS